MENRGHNNFLALHQVKNAVRESADRDSPQLPVTFTVIKRISLDLVQSLFETQEKIVAKALPFLFIELEIRSDIQLRVLSKCERISHYFDNIRALTSAHVLPRSWSSSNACSRWSSSSFWVSVSSISEPSATTLSHSASARMMRSDTVSDCISIMAASSRTRFEQFYHTLRKTKSQDEEYLTCSIKH